ncbi:unnamed protein product, partial [Rotaria sordida]
MLKKNFNENVNRNAADTDLMFNYRHALHGKVHTVLKNKPDALLFQLYIDEISLTNPIGAKKDIQKTTMIYFQLEDLPDIVKSMLNSIGLVAMFEDLNVLQTTGVFIPTLGDYLNFTFTVLAGDHLASNDI